MPTLPSAAALAALVVLAGVGGVVAADPTTVSPTATPTAVENATNATPNEPTTVPPDRDGSFETRLAERLSHFDLTDGQVRTIVNEAVRLRDDGASRMVIRSSVVMNLYRFGVDAPFLYADDGDDPTAADRIAAKLGERFDLTDEQVAEIAATIERMHANGASRAEIYRAVHALLVDYGVDEDELADLRKRLAHREAHQLHQRAHALHQKAHRLHHAAAHDGVSDRPAAGDAVDRRIDALQDRHGLTDAQAAELERLVRSMLADGAPRDAIVDAVRDRLADWGVDRPATDRRTDAAEDRDSDR